MTNMIKCLITVLLALSSVTVKCQNLNQYYTSIYNAESYLTQRKYDSACIMYKIAFKPRFCFYEDVKNAFKATMLTNDIRQRGFIWKNMKRFPSLIYEIKGNVFLFNHKSNYLKRKMLHYKRSVTTSSIEREIDSLRIIDQKVRHECSSNVKPECIKLFRSIDSSNIKYLSKLLSRFIKSNEQVSSSMNQGIFLIGLHARRWGFTDLDTLLVNYINAGKMKPFVFAYLRDYKSDFDSINLAYLNKQSNLGLGYMFWAINDTVIRFRTSDTLSIKTLNANRAKYYMDKVENNIPKIDFILSTELFRFSHKDLCIESFSTQMTKEELNDLILDFRSKGILEE